MDLLFKRSPCPICGGKISWLLSSKIEGQHICDTCRSKIDMESDKESNLTMQEFKEYLAFHEHNQLLKNRFVISERINFGLWDMNIIFDYENKLFCMSKNPDKTVFKAVHLKSFTIKEDKAILFEGSSAGIKGYPSTVPERAMALAPQITEYILKRQMGLTLGKLEDGKANRSAPIPYYNVSEPFRAFHVELHLEHPYWTVIECDINGPRFDNTHPDVNNYLHDYWHRVKELEKLVEAFRMVAFWKVPDQSLGINTASLADTIEEINEYKVLTEQGIITWQEFEAKKKLLLGIWKESLYH